MNVEVTYKPGTANSVFKRSMVTVNGVKAELLTAGEGEPLMFWHGAGTLGGWDFALPWTEKFKVMIPLHPGWGGSDDAAQMTSMQDYVMHYLELLDQLELKRINLVGLSMGGWIAAAFASQHAERIRKLVLVAPAGLRDREHPIADIFRIKPEAILHALTENIGVLLPYLPKDPEDLDFIVERYRESASYARLAWERPYDAKLGNWLHRIKVPTMLVWGEEDKIVPFGQAATWAKLIPNAAISGFAGAGHLLLNERPDAVRAVADFLA
jgi:pimeloyl-ACP methyl ester carboxylesterase